MGNNVSNVDRWLLTYYIFLGTDRFLVFVETKRSADFLASYLSQTGFPTTSIHGYLYLPVYFL